MATSWWHRFAWPVFLGYVAAVFGALPFARDLVLALRSTNLLAGSVTAVYAASVAVVVYHVVFDLRASDWLAFAVVALLIGVIAALLLGLSIPEERVHFLQYAVMALLARNALSSRRPGQVGAARALLGAVVLTSALGVADEGVQWLLPQRVFDLRDIWLNVGAVVVGLALDEALHDRTGLRARLLVPTATGGDP
ncbi:MAG: VanZ family protein [Myxococcales bacterium]|nr:VanZ family protein [Myxococcales bacterium]